MVPVGGFYTIGPQEAKALLDDLRPKVFLPMHYRMGAVGLPAVGQVEDFLSLVENYVYYPTDTLSLDRRDQAPDRGSSLLRVRERRQPDGVFTVRLFFSGVTGVPGTQFFPTTSPGFSAELASDHSFSKASQSRTGRTLVHTSYSLPWASFFT